MRCAWRSPTLAPNQCCFHRLNPPNTRRSVTPNASPRSAPTPRSAPSENARYPAHHYEGALACAHTVLFHLGVVEQPPPPAQQPQALDDRFKGVRPELAVLFVAYLNRKTGTCRPKTVTSLATRLAHFARFLTTIDPGLVSLSGLDRRHHIEPYLNHVANATSMITGGPVTIADQDRRVHLACADTRAPLRFVDGVLAHADTSSRCTSRPHTRSTNISITTSYDSTTLEMSSGGATYQTSLRCVLEATIAGSCGLPPPSSFSTGANTPSAVDSRRDQTTRQ